MARCGNRHRGNAGATVAIARYRFKRRGIAHIQGKRRIRYYIHVQAKRAFRANIESTFLKASQGRSVLHERTTRGSDAYYNHFTFYVRPRGVLHIFAHWRFRKPYDLGSVRIVGWRWNWRCRVP
jgi:hypothetical protein